ncbi:MAG: hypothetical protein RI922_2381 [Bacteroidota bacterium]|jgi:hypothetical protein
MEGHNFYQSLDSLKKLTASLSNKNSLKKEITK